MLFNSLLYLLLFLPIVVLFSYKLKKRDFSKFLIIISSIVFYAYYNYFHLPIIIFSILINYYFSKILIESNYKKIFLFLGVVLNILILSYFKYRVFIIEIVNSLFNQNIFLEKINFPLALSFVTFQQIAYLVDTYNSNSKKKNNFLDYSLFVIFFPQLIAGPIVRFSQFMSQIKNNFLKINFNNLNLGLILISIGIFKKSFLSDNLSIFVDKNFNQISNLNILETWMTSYAWSFQFYFDFSGYVDLALGSALLFSIKLPINFDSPFKAINVIDFWQRWHITLTKFLTNYIYYPLSRQFKNLNFTVSLLLILIVFFISGLWHGPNYTFILFGLINGAGVCFNYLKRKYFDINMNKFFSIFLTFNFINISFIFFRAENLNDALLMIKQMFTFSSIKPTFDLIYFNLTEVFSSYENLYKFIFKDSFFLTFILMVMSILIIFFCKNSNQIKLNKIYNFKYLFLIILIALVGILSIQKDLPFLYFQF